MTITLGTRSLSRLEDVHPDLVRVVHRAAQLATAEQDFTVLEGLRSNEQMYRNYGKGRTTAQLMAKGVPVKYAEPSQPKVTWLNDPLMSNHRRHPDGYGHAVDLAPFPIDWKDLKRFKALMELMESAAKVEGVQIAAGGRWAKPDYPHFELAA